MVVSPLAGGVQEKFTARFRRFLNLARQVHLLSKRRTLTPCHGFMRGG
jgi:hypothetical protein